jgi:glycosyl transferase family 25
MEYIQRALYINLESRGDRRVHVEQQLSTVGITAQRFNAIEMENGAIGCSKSHLKCLEIALENDWEHVLIVEDDILFLNPSMFVTQFSRFIERHQNDFDVVLIGGNNSPPYSRIDDCCVQVTSCLTTTGYLVKRHYYTTLIANIREGIEKLDAEPNERRIYAIDAHWMKLQTIDRWFLITPPTVVQLEDYSDIQKKVVNYTPFMTDLDKPRRSKHC